MGTPTILLVRLCLILHASLSCQNLDTKESIDSYSRQINSIQKSFRFFTTHIDSLSIQIQQSATKIIAHCTFEKSQKILTIAYFLENKSIVLIHASAQDSDKSIFYNNTYFVIKMAGYLKSGTIGVRTVYLISDLS
jgi:hypothetical protein